MGLFSNKTSQLHQHQQHHLNFQQPQHSEYIYNTSYQNDQQTTDRTAEAPYQMSGKRGLKSILGHKELARGRFWLSVLSECLSCYIYVFIVCSTRISWTGSIIGHEPNLLAMALASGLAMMLLIFTFKTVHVNPALTLSFLLTGRISLVRALFYLIAHCFGSIAAVAFLYSISIKGHAGALGLDSPHDVLTDWQILIVEFVITFIVTLATYATCNYSSYTNAKRSILKESAVYESITSKSDHSQHHQKPIEEVMRDECQLLAPNGFALHMSSGQAMVIGFAYILASLSGVSFRGERPNFKTNKFERLSVKLKCPPEKGDR